MDEPMTLAQSRQTFDLTRCGLQSRYGDTPVGQVRLFEGGSGPSLLLLHGIGGGASSYYWARVAPLLARYYRVIAFDFVGWGDSDHPRRHLLFDDYVVQIGAVLDLSGPVFAIAAQGLSAGFAIAAAQLVPRAHVRRFAMLFPTGGRDFGTDSFDPIRAWTISALARAPVLNKSLYRLIFHRREAYWGWFKRRGFFDAAAIPEDLIESSFRSGTHPNAAYAALPFISGALRYDIAPLLRTIDRPSLMLWGSDEKQIQPSIRARLAAVNPVHVRCEIVPRTRTDFEIEAPDLTAAVMLRFLQGDQ
jgi:pimeloyl-ACP methyl ester carboxylesterase